MTEQVEQTQEQVPVADPVVDEAVAQGWVPKEEFQGDEHKWVDAGEFLRRGELFKKIEQVSKTAKRAEQTLAEFKAHYAKVKETEYQHALETLKAERKAALVNGDYERVDDIETRMDNVKAEAATVQTEIKQTTQPPEVYPEVAAWVERNKWYNQDLPMKAYADTVAAQLNKQGITGPALLKGIDEEIRKAFPTKFSNPNRERPGAVESSTIKGSSRRETFELNEQEHRIMNTFVRDGVMTKEQYIADLKKVKGVR
jgi:hypothetical protein